MSTREERIAEDAVRHVMKTIALHCGIPYVEWWAKQWMVGNRADVSTAYRVERAAQTTRFITGQALAGITGIDWPDVGAELTAVASSARRRALNAQAAQWVATAAIELLCGKYETAADSALGAVGIAAQYPIWEAFATGAFISQEAGPAIESSGDGAKMVVVASAEDAERAATATARKRAKAKEKKRRDAILKE